MSFTSNFETDALQHARTLLGTSHGLSVLALTIIDEANRNLQIEYEVESDLHFDSVAEQLLSAWLKSSFNKVYFRSCKLDGKYLTEYAEKQLTENSLMPTSANDFPSGCKFILDMEIVTDVKSLGIDKDLAGLVSSLVSHQQHIYKFYKLNDGVPRIFKLYVR